VTKEALCGQPSVFSCFEPPQRDFASSSASRASLTAGHFAEKFRRYALGSRRSQDQQINWRSGRGELPVNFPTAMPRQCAGEFLRGRPSGRKQTVCTWSPSTIRSQNHHEYHYFTASMFNITLLPKISTELSSSNILNSGTLLYPLYPPNLLAAK
jgi:hypothetical protein